MVSSPYCRDIKKPNIYKAHTFWGNCIAQNNLVVTNISLAYLHVHATTSKIVVTNPILACLHVDAKKFRYVVRIFIVYIYVIHGKNILVLVYYLST